MIKELHAGDTQISASSWNEMRAAVQGITAPQQQYQSAARNPVYITIKNQTGAALPAFSVVKLGAAIYSSRTGSEFTEQAVKNGVEIDGYNEGDRTEYVKRNRQSLLLGSGDLRLFFLFYGVGENARVENEPKRDHNGTPRGAKEHNGAPLHKAQQKRAEEVERNGSDGGTLIDANRRKAVILGGQVR